MSAVNPVAANSAVHHPAHYTAHPSGVEVYEVTQEMWCPNLSNAFKYMARHQHKGNPSEDIRRASEYVKFEINRRAIADNSYGGISLPQMPLPGWDARFAPFYQYVAMEKDKNIARNLILLWNADKNANPVAATWLSQLQQWLFAYAQEIDKIAFAQLSTAKAKENEGVIVSQVHNIRFRMECRELPDWNEWEISYRNQWRPIVSYKVLKYGKVDLTFAGMDGVYSFGPRDNIKIRPKGKK